jgi:putative hydrolase of the HAD superfamily
MAQIRALFWDVGGVLLTNAWDHEERGLAIRQFSLDKAQFEARHKEMVASFEEGRTTLDEYLEHTVFNEPRTFTKAAFQEFMFGLSKPKPEVLEIANRLSGKYFIGTINNESRELNQDRIQRFELKNYFKVFVSSCFVGIRKPDERIYRLALDLTQRAEDECCFIDDRPVNIGLPLRLGCELCSCKIQSNRGKTCRHWKSSSDYFRAERIGRTGALGIDARLGFESMHQESATICHSPACLRATVKYLPVSS